MAGLGRAGLASDCVYEAGPQHVCLHLPDPKSAVPFGLPHNGTSTLSEKWLICSSKTVNMALNPWARRHRLAVIWTRYPVTWTKSVLGTSCVYV